MTDSGETVAESVPKAEQDGDDGMEVAKRMWLICSAATLKEWVERQSAIRLQPHQVRYDRRHSDLGDIPIVSSVRKLAHHEEFKEISGNPLGKRSSYLPVFVRGAACNTILESGKVFGTNA